MASVNIAKLTVLLKSLVGFNSFVTTLDQGIEIKDGEPLKLEFLADAERHRLIGLLNDIEVQAGLLRIALLNKEYEEDGEE